MMKGNEPNMIQTRFVRWSIVISLAWTSSFANAPLQAQTRKDTSKTREASTTKKSKPSSKPTAPLQSSIANRYEKGKSRFVHTNKAVVRSGPGDEYYPALQLPSDARVEVYLETSNGWSGVRPPEGSHNWIPASAAYLLPGGTTAEIVDEETPAWIGSQLTDAPDLLWQIGLQKSQVVQVLGEDTQETADGSKALWYRIAPPPGDFRWIKTAHLSDEPNPPSTSAVRLASHSTNVRTSSHQSESSESYSSDGVGGEVVWSDEHEVLAEVDRQIRREQAQSSSDIPRNGGGNFEGGPTYSDEGDYLTSQDAVSVESEMSPKELARAKRHKNAQHQVDSLRHWDSMQASDPTSRIKPLSSVLGLIGFGVIEAERKPINDQIAEDRNRFAAGERRYGQTLEHQGPVGSSRLDSLPRPGRSPRITTPTPMQFDGLTSNVDQFGAIQNGAETLPLDPNRPMLSRLWESNQPIFGVGNPTGAGMRGMYPEQGMRDWVARDPRMLNGAYAHPGGSPLVGSGPAFGSTRENEEWHGMNTPSTRLTSHAMAEAYDDPIGEATFESPEVQGAMMELTQIVAAPTESWHLAELRNRCRHWIEQGGNSLVRGEARLLMDRIDRFDALRTRTLGGAVDVSRLAATSSTAIPPSLSVAAGSYVQPASASSATIPPPLADTSVGDASGWLVQVHGTVPGQPDYALTDDQGRVITYVQSTAALNLRRYLQQPVIVHGQRGYIPSLAARQITVERVSRLR